MTGSNLDRNKAFCYFIGPTSGKEVEMIWIMVLILFIAIGFLPVALIPEIFSVSEPVFVAIGYSIANPGLNPAPGPECTLSCPQPYPSGFT